MRARIGLVVLTLAAIGCGEIAEDAGALGAFERNEYVSASGRTLDCPDELFASSISEPVDFEDPESAAETPRSAAEDYLPFLDNKGSVQSVPDSETTFVVVDEAGHRLAWLETTAIPGGWFVGSTVECGTTFGDPPPEPSGPCVDGPLSDIQGDLSLYVTGDGAEVEAAFAFAEIGYCPRRGGSGTVANADGFLATLDESVVTVAPGDSISVRGPGYTSAGLQATWETTDAQSSGDGGLNWTLQAPGQPGRYQLDLKLDWAEGRSAYAVLVDVVKP